MGNNAHMNTNLHDIPGKTNKWEFFSQSHPGVPFEEGLFIWQGHSYSGDEPRNKNPVAI